MQRVVVIAEGHVAEEFLARLLSVLSGDFLLDIISPSSDIHVGTLPSFARLFVCDPTSEYRLSSVPLHEASIVFVVMRDMNDVKAVVHLVREKNQTASLVVFDMDGLPVSFIEAYKLKCVNLADSISATLVSFMPNIPLPARNVGRGNGDIMSVIVPYGSKYVSRHLSNIEQKNWRIAAIYRNEQLILPKQSTMIKPQDELVLVGQPAIVKDIYKAIKSEIGHFPQPFGANTYLFLDMSRIGFQTLQRLVDESIRLHKRLNSKRLFIRGFAPNTHLALSFLRTIESSDIRVEFDFYAENAGETVKKDVKRFNIGLVVVGSSAFYSPLKKALYELKKPVLKLGIQGLFDTSFCAVSLSKSADLEKISYLFFDFSLQLGMTQTAFDYTGGDGQDISQILEHYTSLAHVYSTRLHIKKENKNFFREAHRLGNFIQFLPFTSDVLKFSLFDFLAPESVGLYTLLKENHQLFIPIND